VTNFSRPVTTSPLNPADYLVGFQGDLTFDQTVVTFQSPAVSPSGLTDGSWTLTAQLLPGSGPIRTLRISGWASDGFSPLNGRGTLFDLNMTRVSNAPGANTTLAWAESPNDFIFINGNWNEIEPNDTPHGSINITAPPTISISGNADNCASPALPAVSGVLMTLSGSLSESTVTDGSGNYLFNALPVGGNYTITPSKPALTPGSSGINTIDVVAVQRHFLGYTMIPPGCRLLAADVNTDNVINTIDVVAIQRFFLAVPTGIAKVGRYNFSPANRTYPVVGNSQAAQNYDTLVFGDVASPYVP
jgi:hypothetical protein